MRAQACSAVIMLALALTAARAEAQTSFTKVTLKDGRVFEGTLLHELPGGGVKLILLSGEVRELAGDTISAILRPGAKPTAAPPAEPPAPPLAAAPPPTTEQPAVRGEAGESCQARAHCAEGLGCFQHVCRPLADATPPPTTDPLVGIPQPSLTHAAHRPRDDHDGLYGGGLVGGAVGPAFPGVAGVGGATGFLGWRRGMFDLRVGVGGFGAAFPNGALGFAAIRPEVFFFVAGPYGFGFSMGPCVGYYEDNWLGGGALYGGFATATPIALRFEAGSAFLEPSLSAGAIFGSIEQSADLIARPAVLLAFAIYSQ